ncbi:MAG: dTDP-4-amino-4,6-dideoxygalactose transaminase [Anaerolineae bacterium UTCFX2]|jgi:dTDP-4-amino-4,6-dideoxygalactose transaminase|nr:dTDP-4-amino-4,6-dideoxygalactose transaminase [Anaerolineae bacterium]MCZ7553177.1 dTDP-4-amino-4,6-dideoxygalactose transaminase [Anaerolineales bacterium]OQY89604.1 MAG: dTDP-4-amino-4,6-dideoxygalactose transaminase [Anaerolineae bacterium UTCFX2]
MPQNQYDIPFNKPWISGNEHRYMAQAVNAGHISGDGAFTQRCSRVLEEWLGAKRVLLTTSCTHALEMSALLLDLKPGDEIILPAFTFVSTANAFALRGARPVFADIRPDTLNIAEQRIEELITPKTRAIVPVHYAGVGCEMDAILEIARAHGLEVIEDNAHGLLGRYRGRMLGAFGGMATQSFHETKNFTCGEGGALALNQERWIEPAEILREKGTNRSRFFRGQVDKYTWVGLGSSYLPSDVLAAFLLAQLESHTCIQQRRREIWERYLQELRPWAEALGVGLPVVPPDCEPSYHLFYLLLPDLERRSGLIEHLKQRRILAVFHYQPLNTSEMGLRFGSRPGDCPVAEQTADRLVRLPFYNGLTREDQYRVIEAVCSFQY